MSTTPTHSFQVADPPFDNTDAEIVLRSSDNVDFYIHKWPLSRASSVFEDMFSIPSPNDLSNADGLKDGLPVVCAPEDRRTLLLVLWFCYPRYTVNIKFDEHSIRQLFPALDKYMMIEKPHGMLESILLEFLAKDPFVAYAIACQYRMLRVANSSALNSLKFPYDADCFSKEDLQSITGYHLNKFLIYRTKSSHAAIAVVRSNWSAKEIPGAYDTDRNISCSCPGSVITSSSIRSQFYAPRWILTYFERCEKALESRPHFEVVKEEALVTALIVAAAQCDACRPLASKIRPFCERMMDRVRTALEKVPHPFSEAKSEE